MNHKIFFQGESIVFDDFQSISRQLCDLSIVAELRKLL